MDDLMTVTEAAAVFGVNPATVSRWCNAKKLQFCLTPGGHRRIPRKAVEEYRRGGNGGFIKEEVEELIKAWAARNEAAIRFIQNLGSSRKKRSGVK